MASTPAAPLFATTRRYASCMLLRSTTRSMSVRSSDFVCSPVAVPASAPACDCPAFRAVRSPRAALASASASSACIEIGRPTLGIACSGLRPCNLLCPRLTSGSASRRLSTPVASQHAARSPRVLHSHLHAHARRIYAAAFRTRFGLGRFRTAHPAASPPIRFLFVAPALCLRLPSDSQSPATPLPSANTSPCRVCRGLAPPSNCALPGAPKKGRRLQRPALWVMNRTFERAPGSSEL